MKKSLAALAGATALAVVGCATVPSSAELDKMTD